MSLPDQPNPYQFPAGNYAPPMKPAGTPGKVLGPAIALIIVGALNLLLSLNGAYRNLTGLNDGGPPPKNIDEFPALKELYENIKPHEKAINITFSLASLTANCLIIGGGAQMLRLKMYPLAMTGAILAAIPCISHLACCGIGEVVGIWAIIILMSKDVRAMFQ